MNITIKIHNFKNLSEAYKKYNHIYNDKKNGIKKYDKRESHISSKIHMKYICSDNGRHPVTQTFTELHYTSPNYTSLHFTTVLPLYTSPTYTALPSRLV
jgi:hypothetical protein